MGNNPAFKGIFVRKPLSELTKLAEEVYGEGFVVSYTPTSDTNEALVVLDSPTSILTGESKLVIEDDDCLEMLWTILIEKRRLVRKRAENADSV